MEPSKFRTGTGYCEIFPDKIVLTRDGFMEDLAKTDGFMGDLAKIYAGEKGATRIRLAHSVNILIFSVLCIFAATSAVFFWQLHATLVAAEFVFLATGLAFFAVFMFAALLTGFNVSATPVIVRSSITSVAFHKAVPSVTRAYFVVRFTDNEGKGMKRLIFLPGSFSGGKSATAEAVAIMKREGLLK